MSINVNLRRDNITASPIITANNTKTIFQDFLKKDPQLDNLRPFLLEVKDKLDSTISELSSLVVDGNKVIRAVDAYYFLKPSVGFKKWLETGINTKDINWVFQSANKETSLNYDSNLNFLYPEEVKRRAYIRFYKLFVRHLTLAGYHDTHIYANNRMFDLVFKIKTDSIFVRLTSNNKGKKSNNYDNNNLSSLTDLLASKININNNMLSKDNSLNIDREQQLREVELKLSNDVQSVKNDLDLLGTTLSCIVETKLENLENKIDTLNLNFNSFLQLLKNNSFNEQGSTNTNKKIVSVVLPNDNSKVLDAYFTVEQFAIFLGFNEQIDLEVKKQAGILATKLCKARGINRIQTYGNEQFTIVNAYPFYIVKQAYEQLGFNFV